jgi:FecR-like protein
MLTTAFLIMQFIISAKAGLVNAVEGVANVRVNQQVNAGAPIQTGATGRVEVMLNPGSFLRLGENSEVVLDSVDLTDIQVRVVSGIAIIESSAVDKNNPIHVSNGDQTQSIASPGVYKFTENGSPEQTSALEQWSQQRSKEIAAINARSALTDSASNYPTAPYGQLMYPVGPLGPVTGGTPFLTPYSVFQPYSLFQPYGFYQPYSLFPLYGGGFRLYRPLVPTAPIAALSPVPPRLPIRRPAPLPASPTTVRPVRPAPPAPRSMPSRSASRGVHGGHR